MSQIQVRDSDGRGIPNIRIRFATGNNSSEQAIYDNVTDGAGNSTWPIPYWPKRDHYYTLWFNTQDVDLRYESASLVATDGEDQRIVLASTVKPLPPLPAKPSRAEILTAQISFQGLFVETQQFGRLPWFEPAIGWFTGPTAAADRQAVYAVKRAAGDKLVNVAVSSQYQEPNQAYQHVPGRDFSTDLPALYALCREIISEGFYVLLMCGGDGEGEDPVGLTHGWTWLMANFERIVEALVFGDNDAANFDFPTDLTPYIIFCPGYDGCVPEWQPKTHVDEFLLLARRALGVSRYLALELSAGYASWGDGGDNWRSPAGQAVDLILQEFPFPMGPPVPAPADWDHLSNEQRAPWSQVWLVQYMIRPYHRPADQPASFDPAPPHYLAGGTPRGPFVYSAFEYDLYGWVRNPAPTIIAQHRAYLRSLGCALVG